MTFIDLDFIMETFLSQDRGNKVFNHLYNFWGARSAQWVRKIKKSPGQKKTKIPKVFG